MLTTSYIMAYSKGVKWMLVWKNLILFLYKIPYTPPLRKKEHYKSPSFNKHYFKHFPCNWKRGPAARSSKANKETRLVERKVCSSGGRGGGRTPVQTLTPLPRQSGGKSFYRQREGATCRSSTVSSDSHLEIGHQWSDQRHLDCFRYS